MKRGGMFLVVVAVPAFAKTLGRVGDGKVRALSKC